MTSRPGLDLPPSRTLRARATGSAPAIASLTRSPSSDGLEAQPQDAGVDPGQLEEVVDHPHHPVDLGADLPVVALRVVGHAVLERLGHRAHPGQRRAQVVRDPRDQLAARLLEPSLALARLGEPRLVGGQLGETVPGTRPGRRRSTSSTASSPEPARLGRSDRDQRASALPSTSATEQRDDARRRTQTSTTDAEVVVGDEHRPGGADHAGEHGEHGDDARPATSCQRSDVAPQQPAPAARPTTRRRRPTSRRRPATICRSSSLMRVMAASQR